MSKRNHIFKSKVGVSFFKTIIPLLSLFFLCGYAYSMLEVLNHFFEGIISTDNSKYLFMLIAYYGGFFLIPLPTSYYTDKYGYKSGIIFSLLIFFTGIILFFLTALLQSYSLFFVSLFFVAMGIASLETVISPYAALIGRNEYSALRVSLGHFFSSVGWLLGPIVGSSLLSDVQLNSAGGRNIFEAISLPYGGIGIFVLLVLVLFLTIRLPKTYEDKYFKSKRIKIDPQHKGVDMFKQKHFTGAFVAMIFCLLSQTAVFGIFTTYLVEQFRQIENQTVSGQTPLFGLLQFFGDSLQMNESVYNAAAGSMKIVFGYGLYMLGLLAGCLMLIRTRPYKLLTIFSVSCLLLTIVFGLDLGFVSFIALCLIAFFMSGMFPLIFSLGIRKMGKKTKRAAAFLIMAIAGGSLYPVVLGIFPNVNLFNVTVVTVFVSFAVVLLYGFNGYMIDAGTRSFRAYLKSQLNIK